MLSDTRDVCTEEKCIERRQQYWTLKLLGEERKIPLFSAPEILIGRHSSTTCDSQAVDGTFSTEENERREK